jgi:hypothetical protein
MNGVRLVWPKRTGALQSDTKVLVQVGDIVLVFLGRGNWVSEGQVSIEHVDLLVPEAERAVHLAADPANRETLLQVLTTAECEPIVASLIGTLLEEREEHERESVYSKSDDA